MANCSLELQRLKVNEWHPETFLLSNTSFLSYLMNNFLKENKLPWQGRDKSIHEEANTVNFLKATTSHKRPLCK